MFAINTYFYILLLIKAQASKLVRDFQSPGTKSILKTQHIASSVSGIFLTIKKGIRVLKPWQCELYYTVIKMGWTITFDDERTSAVMKMCVCVCIGYSCSVAFPISHVIYAISHVNYVVISHDKYHHDYAGLQVICVTPILFMSDDTAY